MRISPWTKTSQVTALDLEGDGTLLLAGLGLTRVVEFQRFEVWPQLRLDYGRTEIGSASFEVQAYGLADKVYLDASDTAMANLLFTPEFRMPLFADADNADDDQDATLLTFGLCTQKKGLMSKTRDCGAGSLSRQWGDRGSFDTSITANKVGEETRTGVQLGLNYAF